jgi:hypothetical protein
MGGRTRRVRQKSQSDFWTPRPSRGGPERSGGRAAVPGREQSHPRGRHYLYRAVDRYGKSVHSLLCRDRSLESAQAFFREAVAAEGASWPTKINLDGNAATHRALRMLGDEDSRWQSVEIRARRYLNHIVEQDHRAIKRRCVSMLGLKSYRSAATTFAGIELAHRIRKGQFSMPVEVQERTSTLKDQWNRALDCSSGLVGQTGGQIPSMHQI